MRLQFIAAFLVCALGLVAQTPEKFNYLQSWGNLPSDFTQSFEAQYRNDIAKIPVGESNEVRAQKAIFYAQSAFFIRQMLYSGKVTFNDPISNYAAQIADLILKDDWEFRQKLRFYTIKTDIVNAFTTNNGIIFLTTGLVARLKNEAQLAFILCHEMVHYKNAHVLTGFLNNEKIDKKAGIIKLFELQQRQLEKLSFSRELELEADAEGMLLYTKTGYSPMQAIEALRLIEQNELPFYTNPVAWEILEGAHLTVPDSIRKKVAVACDIEIDENDSTSTHPNTLKRIAQLDGLQPAGDSSAVLYVLNPAAFESVAALAKMEVIRQNLIQTQYDYSLYQATNMAKEFPNIPFLRKAIVKSLYQIYVYAHDEPETDNWHADIDSCSNMSVLGEYINSLDSKALNQLALFTALEALNQFPEDEELKWYCNELKRFLETHHHLKIAIEFDPNDTLPSDQTIAGNMLDERFYADNTEGLISAYTANPEFTSTVKYLFSIQKDSANTQPEKRTKKLALVAPMVTYYDENNQTSVFYFDIEQLNKQLTTTINEVITAKDSAIALLQLNEASTATDLNRIALLNDWQEEFLNHDGQKTRLSVQEQIEPIANELGISNFGWMMHAGVKPAVWKRIVKGCCYSALIVTIPLGIYYFLKPENLYYYSYSVYNLSTGKRLVNRESVQPQKISLSKVKEATLNSLKLELKY